MRLQFYKFSIYFVLMFLGFLCLTVMPKTAYAVCPAISTVTTASNLVLSFPDARSGTAANLAAAEGRLTYDPTTKSLRFCNGDEWVSLMNAPTLPSDRTDSGSLSLDVGTAARLYTPYVTLAKGVYIVNLYNCLAGASPDHYVNTSGEAQSGTLWCGSTNAAFSQMATYTSKHFICKVRSPTASVRFYVWNPNGTITNGASCSNFEFVLIAN